MTTYQPPTHEEIRSIAHAYYLQRQAKALQVDQPTLVLVGGQPGAGKSAAAALVRAEFKQTGGFVHLDADRMRERIDLRGAKPTSEQTQVTAGALVAALRAVAIEGRRNLLEEGTFRNPDGLLPLVQRIQSGGYRVELVAVATPLEESRLGIYQRFEAQHAQRSLNPRFVFDRYHDESADGFAATVAKIADRFDRVRVISREGHLFYDSQDRAQAGTAIDALKQGRSIDDARLAEVCASWKIVKSLAEGRGAERDHLLAIDRNLATVVGYIERRREFESAMDDKRVPASSRQQLRELFDLELQKRHATGEISAARGVEVAGVGAGRSPGEDRSTTDRARPIDRSAPER